MFCAFAQAAEIKYQACYNQGDDDKIDGYSHRIADFNISLDHNITGVYQNACV